MVLACSPTDWIQAVAVLAGVVIAGLGLRTWRKQLRGTLDHDAALGLLERALEVRDGLQAARQSCTFARPISSREDASHALGEVDKSIRIALRRLDTARVRGEAVFGPDAQRAVDPLYSIVARTRQALQREFESRTEDGRPVSEEMGALAGWSSDDPEYDAGTKAVLDAVEPIETWAAGVLR